MLLHPHSVHQTNVQCCICAKISARLKIVSMCTILPEYKSNVYQKMRLVYSSNILYSCMSKFTRVSAVAMRVTLQGAATW